MKSVAHAALADLLQQLVEANVAVGAWRDGPGVGCGDLALAFLGRPAEEAAGLGVGLKQPLDTLAQAGVAAARLGQERRAAGLDLDLRRVQEKGPFVADRPSRE